MRIIATAITRDPATVNGYVARLRPATEFLGLATIVGIAAVARASLARRVAILLHVVIYIALSVLGFRQVIAIRKPIVGVQRTVPEIFERGRVKLIRA